MVLILAGLIFLLGSFYIPLKAQLAQYLLQQSWELSKTSKQFEKPWPWADIHPIAKLKIHKIGLDMVVLSGASGESLAFAPAHVSDSVFPGEVGNSVISAHKDTHFLNIHFLQQGDEIEVLYADGRSLKFHVTDNAVLDLNKERLSINAQQNLLTLMTCYPIGKVYSDPNKRLVVIAKQAGGYQI